MPSSPEECFFTDTGISLSVGVCIGVSGSVGYSMWALVLASVYSTSTGVSVSPCTSALACVALLNYYYLSNTASCVFYGVTCLIRLL